MVRDHLMVNEQASAGIVSCRRGVKLRFIFRLSVKYHWENLAAVACAGTA
jgi:hypothetical protein